MNTTTNNSHWKSHFRCMALGSVVALTFAGWSNAADPVIKFGYTLLDESGSRGIQQGAYNVYEGAGISVEGLLYQFENGSRLSGNFQNLTMNNRNLNGRLTRSGRYNLTLSHNKYRRIYAFDGDKFTRREQTNASFWLKPSRAFKLFGGFGVTAKQGQSTEFFEPGLLTSENAFDYTQRNYHAGATYSQNRRTLTAEFRGSRFHNSQLQSDKRETRRYRVTAATPAPNLPQVTLNAGFQRFENSIERVDIDLSSNSFWAGARTHLANGITARYSFIFDRTVSDSDLAATDNLTHALTFSKRWRRSAQLTLGYRRSLNDDAFDELTSNGFLASGWARLSRRLVIKSSIGSENSDVTRGATLTGAIDHSRYRASLDYSPQSGSITGGYEYVTRENNDIGSATTFKRASLGLSLTSGLYGTAGVTYSLASGEFRNTEDSFEYTDHTLSGDLLSRFYGRVQFGISGLYYRSLRDADVESLSLRFVGRINLSDEWRFEGVYDGRDFDDLTALNSHYAANILTVSIIKKLNLGA